MAEWKIDTDAGHVECIYVVFSLCPFCSLLPQIFRITIGLEDKADAHTHTHTHTHIPTQSKYLYYFIHVTLFTIVSTVMLYSVKYIYIAVLCFKRLLFSLEPIIYGDVKAVLLRTL